MQRGAMLRRLGLLLQQGAAEQIPAAAAAAPSAATHRTSAAHLAAQRGRGVATSSAASGQQQAAPTHQATSAAGTQSGAQQHGGSGGNSGGNSGGGRRMGPVLLLPAAFAAGLGAWQLARRADKVQQLEDRLAAMREEPQDVFAAMERLPEFAPVAAEGVYDETSTVFIGPRVRSAMGGTIAGKLVVTPLQDDGRGTAALVVRGWAPAAWRPVMSSEQKVRVEAVTRSSEPRGGFVPDNVPGRGPGDPDAQWYWLEGPAIARAVGLPPDTPLIEAVSEQPPRDSAPSAMEVLGGRTSSLGNSSASYPQPRTREELLRFPVMPQGHLNYAATWFTLSGCIAAAALVAMRRTPRHL